MSPRLICCIHALHTEPDDRIIRYLLSVRILTATSHLRSRCDSMILGAEKGAGFGLFHTWGFQGRDALCRQPSSTCLSCTEHEEAVASFWMLVAQLCSLLSGSRSVQRGQGSLASASWPKGHEMAISHAFSALISLLVLNPRCPLIRDLHLFYSCISSPFLLLPLGLSA